MTVKQTNNIRYRMGEMSVSFYLRGLGDVMQKYMKMSLQEVLADIGNWEKGPTLKHYADNVLPFLLTQSLDLKEDFGKGDCC